MSETPIVANKSEHFIPLDVWDLTIASTYTRPVIGDSNFLLTNLIFNNLKIQSLLEEYRRLQEEAKKFQNRSQADRPTNLEPSITGTNKARQQFDRIENELSILFAALAAKNRHLAPSFHNFGLDLRSLANLSGANNEIKNESIVSKINQQINRNWGNRNIPTDNSGFAGTMSNSTAITREVQHLSGTKPTEASLPWFIRHPLNLFQYATENKIEVVLYGCLLYLIYCLLSIRLRRH